MIEREISSRLQIESKARLDEMKLTRKNLEEAEHDNRKNYEMRERAFKSVVEKTIELHAVNFEMLINSGSMTDSSYKEYNDTLKELGKPYYEGLRAINSTSIPETT